MKSRALLLAVACLSAISTAVEPAEAKGPKGKNPDKLTNPTSDAIFKYLDKDKDDSLTLEELKDVKTGAEATEAEKRFKTWDADGSGMLSRDEYRAGVAATPIPKREKAPPKKKPAEKKPAEKKAVKKKAPANEKKKTAKPPANNKKR